MGNALFLQKWFPIIATDQFGTISSEYSLRTDWAST
jgi:hypothetical protein